MSTISNRDNCSSVGALLRQAGLRATLSALPAGQLTMLVGSFLVSRASCHDTSTSYCHVWMVPLAVTVLGWLLLAKRDMDSIARQSRWTVVGHTLLSGIVATLIAYKLHIEFPQAMGIDAVFLGCFSMAAMTSGGFAFSFTPSVGIIWLVPFFVSNCWALYQSASAQAAAMGFLFFLYSAYVVFAIVSLAKGARERMKNRIQAEEQNEVIKLLLHDFEENAGDWLWETDAQGHFTYVSSRMDGVLGPKLEQTGNKDAIALIARSYPVLGLEEKAMLKRLQGFLDNPRPFKDETIKVYINGELHWWSLSAKPLLSTDGNVIGWRGVGRDITHLRRTIEDIERQANYDVLTGIPNRFFMRKQLDVFFADGGNRQHIAFVQLSISNFKSINSIYGHNNGDQVLSETAARLQKFSNTYQAVVARIGGSDFSIFIPQASEYVEAILEIFLETLMNPILIGEGSMEIKVKAGCVLGSSSISGTDYVLQCAEMALAAAKEKSDGNLVLFDQMLADKRIRQMSLVSDLRFAVKNEELFAFYQPQIRVCDGSLAGAEALIRWASPRVGFVSPADFIPLAEKNGHIIEMGNWMLDKACRDALLWPYPIKVAINASAIQLEQSSFVAQVLDAASCAQLPLHRLKIEITESAFIGDSEKVKKSLTSLREHGIAIALDDFGTGYSSLSYLSKYPISELKIDQSFVRTMERNQDSVKIVETIVRLAKNLDLTTTAEGVETEYQAHVLKELGCDYYQGYLYGKPMPHSDLIAYANKQVGQLL
jgi:diguanylate cyclase (GGDEF)-like protein/PAS domain S-box-containing protein